MKWRTKCMLRVVFFLLLIIIISVSKKYAKVYECIMYMYVN